MNNGPAQTLQTSDELAERTLAFADTVRPARVTLAGAGQSFVRDETEISAPQPGQHQMGQHRGRGVKVLLIQAALAKEQ